MTLSTVIFLAIFLLNLQLNIGKKYLKTAKIIDESLILAIVLCNYSTKPSYIFQLKRDLKVQKYIFNLFHFEMLIQNRNPKFRPFCLFVLTFHEYEARFQKSTNQKQELPVVAMFVNGSLQRTAHRCFLPSFGSFGQAVSEEKNLKNQPIRNKSRLWWPCFTASIDA